MDDKFIGYDEGRAAFKRGEPYDKAKSYGWRCGWCDARFDANLP